MHKDIPAFSKALLDKIDSPRNSGQEVLRGVILYGYHMILESLWEGWLNASCHSDNRPNVKDLQQISVVSSGHTSQIYASLLGYQIEVCLS